MTTWAVRPRTGALRVRVERDPADSVIARIVRMVAEASGTKAPTQLFIEKVEQRHSVGMVLATLAVFALPLVFGDELRSAPLRAMTFVIVASPCAVVLSTTPPLLSAIANAGRDGVLAKSAVVMERLGQIDAVALDKTGNLTEGTSPRVTDIRPLPAAAWTRTPCAGSRPRQSCREALTRRAPPGHPEPGHRRCVHHRVGRLGLIGSLPLPLGVAGHEGSTVIVGPQRPPPAA
jgi:hypothetical protein